MNSITGNTSNPTSTKNGLSGIREEFVGMDGMSELSDEEMNQIVGGASLESDVAVLITAKPLTLGSGASAIELPAQESDLAGGTQVTVSGWNQ